MKVYLVCGCCEEIMGLARKFPANTAPLTLADPGDIISADDGPETFYYEGLCDDCRNTLHGDNGRHSHALYFLH